jgi:predicted RNA-binding protein YlqC (UPF0109 family)
MAQIERKTESKMDPLEQRSPAALLEEIVRSFVIDVDQVLVETQTDDDGSLITLRVSAADFAMVNGSKGRTARSLHAVVSALAKRHGVRLALDIQPRN